MTRSQPNTEGSAITGFRSRVPGRYLLAISLLCNGLRVTAADDIAPVVEVEEDIYSYTNAQNGAGPMWCTGSTTLVRTGDRLFASGLETIPDAKPLNNCRWMLFLREDNGWTRVRVDADGRTREPSPLVAFADGRLFLSVNPTLGKGPEPDGGPARPDVLQFSVTEPTAAPGSLAPVWQGKPAFTEHSYRTFVADGARGELLLFQNIGYTHAEWTFRDSAGKWNAQGQLKWPWDTAHAKPGPIRVCYPNVALRDRAVHFVGVSDVLEPNPAWRTFKRELTGQQWDYDFRRLFYSWTPDVTKQPFAEWVEIASRDATGGHVQPGDLWLSPSGDAHLIWSERAIDERLRERFFPDAKQSEQLNYAVVRGGKVVHRRTIMETQGGGSGLSGSASRFHVTPDHRLFVVYRIVDTGKDGRRTMENRIVELLLDGTTGTPVLIPLKKQFNGFFTTTVRAGSSPSWTLEMLGQRERVPNTISYARVNLTRRITTHGFKNHTVRTEGWRNIRYANGDEELYDEAADPLEYTNLAKHGDHAARKAELARWLPKTDAANLPGSGQVARKAESQ